jgi:hypothetical protein
MTDEELQNIFTYHAPKGNQPKEYEMLRDGAHVFAHLINGLCPESREKSLAITAIQQAVMWANASKALHE